MAITSFLHKLLFTYTYIDRYFVFNPTNIEAHMFSGAIGLELFTYMIMGYVFSLIMFVFWIPNTYLFHYPWLLVKIAILIIAGIISIPFSKIQSSEPYKEFVREHYYDSKFPTLKWHLLAHGLHIVSVFSSISIIIFM